MCVGTGVAFCLVLTGFLYIMQSLLIDNATGHNLSSIVTKELTNVKIHYFLPNCTSHLLTVGENVTYLIV